MTQLSSLNLRKVVIIKNNKDLYRKGITITNENEKPPTDQTGKSAKSLGTSENVA